MIVIIDFNSISKLKLSKYKKSRNHEPNSFIDLKENNEEFSFDQIRKNKESRHDYCNASAHKSLLEASKILKGIADPFSDEFQPDFKMKLLSVLNSKGKNAKIKVNNKSRKQEKTEWREKPLDIIKTMIIYDWDDTLLCTSSLFSEGYEEDWCVSCSVQETLKKLEDAVFKILDESLKQGKVYIITNSTDGWVEYSASKYMPRVRKLLEKISIVSARSNYEFEYPLNFNQWKLHAFMDTIKDVDTNTVTNLLSIGDSNIEIEASKQLLKSFPNAFLKTIKFRELPTPKELIKQIGLITERFENIWNSEKNITVKLERKDSQSGDKTIN